jgi:hypothetical protein
MKRIMVNIVSAQTIPNYLFIKEFGDDADIFLFVSTDEMEKSDKTATIYRTAGIDKKDVRKILINENELYLAKDKLDRLGWRGKDYMFLVNITGGTKLMSNAVYEYFKELNSRFFYLPIGQNTIKELFNDRKADEKPVKYKLRVEEYLNLHNIHPETKELQFPKKEVMNILIKNPFDTDIPQDQNKYSLWFEHLLYYKIKDLLKLVDDEIKTGVKLFKKKPENSYFDNLVDNEVDVVFVKDNRIYVVEAKVSVGRIKVNTTTVSNYLYKLAAINKRFGLNSKAAFMTFSDFSSLLSTSINNLEKKCSILGLPYPFDKNDIIDDNKFKNRILTLLK